LTGETGTGKEVIARAIHETSDRAGRSFIPINCAAIPEALLESVLFGHEKGAFTGAYAKSAGKFEQAEGGTILLDEIGEMSRPLQAKLLRVLQEKQVDRIGGRESIPVDVRIIAATHRDLQKKVLQREFREDLYYRLNIYPIELPALRLRKEDIPLLADHAGESLLKRGYPKVLFAPDALAAMMAYDWPGNVRELMNLVERVAVQSAYDKREETRAAQLPAYLTKSAEQKTREGQSAKMDAPVGLPDGQSLPEFLKNIEREIIDSTLRETGQNIACSARLLGIPRTTLISRVKALTCTSNHQESAA
jgi:transcriptional regulator with GAF, ATPase, and Fis domain